MPYRPHDKTIATTLAFFRAHADRYGETAQAIEAFVAQPSLTTAEALTETYFRYHTQGDLEAMRRMTSVYADKRLVRSVVESILNDEEALARIATQSYPHPIGFDKLVLNHHKPGKPGDAAEHKLRLHIYWRSPQEIMEELEHLHKFEMASADVSGELSNHESKVVAFRPVDGQELTMTTHPMPEGAQIRTLHAYTGYQRDPDGTLHKRYLGEVDVAVVANDTFLTGEAYAQTVEHAHYVETNAETGHANGDICSTIYIHGPNLIDKEGRAVPVLLEPERLAKDDTLISTIPSMTTEYLRDALTRYRDHLSQSLEYYDWLYDPKYGRNLSVGMLAGYILSERLNNPQTVTLWSHRHEECLDVLEEASTTLGKLVRGEMKLEDIDDGDRCRRYYRQLLEKAMDAPEGPEAWLEQNGDLKKEMWRYLGALIGDHARNPRITMLKPSWEKAPDLQGGAHYGPVAAMLEAAYKATHMLNAHFRRGDIRLEHGKNPHDVTSALDHEVDDEIRRLLLQHYPDYRYDSEDGAKNAEPPKEGDRRFLVDSLDATRNYFANNDKFAVSLSCQLFENGAWKTTEAVIAEPANGRVYWAEKGAGAFCIDKEGGRETKLIRPRRPEGPPPAMHEVMEGKIVDVSIRGLGPAKYSFLQKINELGAVDHATGCAALMLAMTAGHGNHAAVITANPHDVAAGMLIAEEAGAAVHSHQFQRDGRNFTAYLASRDPHLQTALKTTLERSLAAARGR